MTTATVSSAAALRRALLAIEQLRSKVEAYQNAEREPIAIVGIGCRFPGGADSPDAYWKLLRDGVDAISEIPPDRWDVNAFYHEDPDAPGKMYCRYGGFLHDIYGFDAAFFGIAPREASRMDPQQRLILEVAWEALESAGIVPTTLGRSATGVFIGVSLSDYGILQFAHPELVDTYTATGTVLSIISNRLSYVLDLRGPSMAIDTACSSALVAVHEACRSLRTRECNLAIAGGVNMMIAPGVTVGASRLRALAPDGRCKTFDARADGYVRGEGCGVVVLKRLSDALAAGDVIAAVIRGSAVSNEGRSNGLTAPSGPAQQALFRQALANAGVDPLQVTYIEAHGTGTALGDPIEVSALAPIYGARRDDGLPCLLGSVKSNFGHLEAAAGIAGLIKVALCLNNRAVVPTLHFNSLNPHIALEGTRFSIATHHRRWPDRDVPFFAAVSSFGIGGSIAHAILEEAPGRTEQTTGASISRRKGYPYLLPLSARAPAALLALAESFREVLAQGSIATSDLRDICYTASVRRTHHEYRLAVVGETPFAMAEALRSFLAAENRPDVVYGQCRTDGSSRVVFVFPGQGSQWLGMGRHLLQQERVFREALEACNEAVQHHAGWSVLDEIHADEAGSHLARLDVIQPCIFAIQVALAAQWRAFGVEPVAVIGHSMGEIAAAHVAGALSLQDAARVICKRSRIAQEHIRGQGGMAVVELSLEDAQKELAGYENELVVAASNGPTSSVLSGNSTALDALLESFTVRGIFGRRVKVDYASHSPHVDPIKRLLQEALDSVHPSIPTIPFYSTVTGARMKDAAFGADYWVRNLREPVLFWPTIRTLVQEQMNVFLEISPHPVLTASVEDGLRYLGLLEGACVESLRRDQNEHACLMTSLGRLYTLGYPVEFQRLYKEETRHVVALPCYPWQRQKYWLPEVIVGNRLPVTRGLYGHPILGSSLRFTSSVDRQQQFWECSVTKDLLPYWTDHRLWQSMVFPSAGYLEIAIAAASELAKEKPIRIDDFSIRQALTLPDEGSRTIQIAVIGHPQTGAHFSISAQEDENSDWTILATGRVQTLELNEEHARPPAQSIVAIQQRCVDRVSKEQHYRRAHAGGVDYGPAFQGVVAVWCGDREVLAQVQWPEALRGYTDNYNIHPAILDACFQIILNVLGPSSDSTGPTTTWLPVGVRALCQHAPVLPGSPLWAHARLVAGESLSGSDVSVDILVLDGVGNLLVDVQGLSLSRSDRRSEKQVDNWLFTIAWQDQTAAHPEPVDASGTWLLLADRGGVGQTLREELEHRGGTCVSVCSGREFRREHAGLLEMDPAQPEHFHWLLEELVATGHTLLRGVVYLFGLDTLAWAQVTPEALNRAIDSSCMGVLYLVHALAAWREEVQPRLWLVTVGAQAVRPGDDVAVNQAPLWGLGRVVAREHPELRCTLLDIGSSNIQAETEMLLGALCHDGRESELALREGRLMVARLIRRPAIDVDRNSESTVTMVPGRDAFRLDIAHQGSLDGLSLHPCNRRDPGPGEIEIAVRAAGLNFLDVLKALGQCPSVPEGEAVSLGAECAGIVAAVGTGVTGFKVGDEVIAVLAPHSFSSFVTVGVNYVVSKPVHQKFEDAATIPAVFLTAWYALRYQARLSPGERVLIHAAAGGVGLAAIQVARYLGAEVYATAGSPEKRAYLKSIGIDHVFDSRSLTFVGAVRECTGGTGVDVVLNSLPGEYIPASLSLLRPLGRFVEIGKRDIYGNSRIGLEPFKHNISFYAVDLEVVAHARPELISQMLQEVMNGFKLGQFSPICRRVFAISRAHEAFRFMAGAKHIGKIALTFHELHVPVSVAAHQDVEFHPDGTYLITGGLGGIGLVVSRWMAERGARHLVLMGRRGPSEQSQPALASLVDMGVEVRVMCGDVSVQEDVQRVMGEIDSSMPALRGIIHAAGVLDDSTLLKLDRTRFWVALAPKVSGAWNLHLHTRDRALDHFVMFSSLAGILGAPGQGNYAAASTFLDALAWHRRALGLSAQSIDWGTWSEVGLAAVQANRGERLAAMGVTPLSPAQATDALGRVFQQSYPQVAVGRLDAQNWRGSVMGGTSSILAGLTASSRDSVVPAETTSIRSQLIEAKPAARASILTGHVKTQVALALQLDIEQIRGDTSFRNMGMDSLTSLELRNRLQASLDLNVSAATIWNYPTVSKLVVYVADRLGVPLVDMPNLQEKRDGEDVDFERALDELSDDELADLADDGSEHG